MSEVRYPEVTVQLSGEDGNAGVIMGKVSRDLLRANVSQEEIDAYRKESMSGDYDNVLTTAMDWVNVE